MARATRSTAYHLLHQAKVDGDIFDFRRAKINNRNVFVVEVQSTHYAHYHDKEMHGEIVLTPREVLAFTEGRWAARKFHPVNRAGDDRAGGAIRDYEEAKRAREEREQHAHLQRPS